MKMKKMRSRNMTAWPYPFSPANANEDWVKMGSWDFWNVNGTQVSSFAEMWPDIAANTMPAAEDVMKVKRFTQLPCWVAAPERLKLETERFLLFYGGESDPDIIKVGPKGYIHGWIKVEPGDAGNITSSDAYKKSLAKSTADISKNLRNDPITPIEGDDYGPAQGHEGVALVNRALAAGDAGKPEEMINDLKAASASLRNDKLDTSADRIDRAVNNAERKARYDAGKPDELTKLTKEDFLLYNDSGIANDKSYEKTIHDVAANLHASDSDLRALAAEEGDDGAVKLSGDALKNRMVGNYVYGWRGSSGGPVPVAMITHVNDKFSRPYKLSDEEENTNAYIAARPAVQRAAHALGDAMYATTQEWLKNHGIKNVELYRASRGLDWDKTRPFTSWSTMSGWIRESNTGGIRHESVPAERIFSLPPTGFGTYAESEAVVLPAKPGEVTRDLSDEEL